MLHITTRDLAFKQQDDRWVDTLEIFAVKTDDGLQAYIEAKTLKLALKAATYQSLLDKGISSEQFVKPGDNASSERILVLDENSGLMGSITVPAALLRATP